MLARINQKRISESPKDWYHFLIGLGVRGLMSPSYLSQIIMLAVLPAQIIFRKKTPLASDPNGFCTKESWFKRMYPQESDAERRSFDYFYQNITQTHTFRPLMKKGIEVLEVAQKKQKDPCYEVFFCGNGQDAMSLFTVATRLRNDKNKNYLFWNYPGVGQSTPAANASMDLFTAAYQQVKNLLDQGIPAKKITLHGVSLGGGVATRVARQLHEEGHWVSLEVDRSFATLSSVVPAHLSRILVNPLAPKQSPYAPFLSSVVALSVSGIALATTVSGFISSLGLISAHAIAASGHLGALCFYAVGFFIKTLMKLIGELIALPFRHYSPSMSIKIKNFFDQAGAILVLPFNFSTLFIRKAFTTLSCFVDNAVNIMGSTLGAGIAVAGVIGGGLLGLVFGMILSIQRLWTNKPWTLPLASPFKAALFSSCCEMNSVKEMRGLLKAGAKVDNIHDKAKITVINTLDDEVIPVNVALNTGLGLPPHAKDAPLKQNINSFWYREGGHCGEVFGRVPPEYAPI